MNTFEKVAELLHPAQGRHPDTISRTANSATWPRIPGRANQ